MIVLFRVRTSYRKYLDNSVEELCKVVAGGANVLFDMMLRPFFDTYTPGFLHPCPYFGKLEFTNFSILNPNDSSNYVFPSNFIHTKLKLYITKYFQEAIIVLKPIFMMNMMLIYSIYNYHFQLLVIWICDMHNERNVWLNIRA